MVRDTSPPAGEERLRDADRSQGTILAAARDEFAEHGLGGARVDRIAGRAKAEGRADDNPESVRTRLDVYESQTAPVVEFYRQHGQLTAIDGVGSLDEVFTRILEAIAPATEVG